MWKVCVAYISFVLVAHAVSAQESTDKFEIGIHAGAAIYQGDLTPSPFGSFKTVRTASGVHANIILSEAFSFRPNFDFGTLEGDDSKYNDKPWRQQRISHSVSHSKNFRSYLFGTSGVETLI
jgi:hypothetical protein